MVIGYHWLPVTPSVHVCSLRLSLWSRSVIQSLYQGPLKMFHSWKIPLVFCLMVSSSSTNFSYWQVWIVWRLKSLTLKPMLVLSYAAILVFKTVDGDKTYQKAVHLTLNGVAVLVALVGVAAAYKFHLDNKFDNFYSLHSWFGITTIIFYLVQVNSLAIMLNDSFNCQFWK